MDALNSVCNTAVEFFLSPLAQWPLLALVVCSAVTGVLMSVVFRFTSNQKGLGRVVDRTQGHLLAIKLFKDDLRGMFRSLAKVLQYVVMRLWYSLVPVLVMLIPLILLLSQLALRYEHRPLAVGESAVVELQLKQEAWAAYQDLKMVSPPAVQVETDALRDSDEQSIYWRIRAVEPDVTRLGWRVGSKTIEKQFVAAEDEALCRVSPRRPGTGWWDRVLYAGEPTCGDNSPVAGINIRYPHRSTPILGVNIPWWLTFFVVSIVAALLMQPIVKVRF